MTRMNDGLRALALLAVLSATPAFGDLVPPVPERAVDTGRAPSSKAAPPAPSAAGTDSAARCDEAVKGDFKTLASVTGKIESLRTSSSCQGRLKTLEAQLASGGQKVTAHLAPPWYLVRAGMRLSVGDEITVKGVWQGEGDGKVLVGAELVKGERRASLRDPTGKPRWRGGRG